MPIAMEKAAKIGTEITVRISMTFQEAPDVHTLLAMTPVRDRGKLVRLALERYIAETAHPAGAVDQQILAISEWLRSREKSNISRAVATPAIVPKPAQTAPLPRQFTVSKISPPDRNNGISAQAASPSVARWLEE